MLQARGTETIEVAGPVLKWAGGKTQLLGAISREYPKELAHGEVKTYIEPFIGGGAVFFDITNHYNVGSAFLFDINPELIVLYNSLKKDVEGVIENLDSLSSKYLCKETEARKLMYYEIRDTYNNNIGKSLNTARKEIADSKRAAYTIFLNRTCFNGLFRVNSKGSFNVPQGNYKNPTILFEGKLRAASYALQSAEIKLADFNKAADYVSGKTFIYYDPPYRPLSSTASFTSYSKDGFGDDEQIRLADMYKKLHNMGVLQLLSNSDPYNMSHDPFFDELYAEFNIKRVDAKRMINSDASKRSSLKELLIMNYQ